MHKKKSPGLGYLHCYAQTWFHITVVHGTPQPSPTVKEPPQSLTRHRMEEFLLPFLLFSISYFRLKMEDPKRTSATPYLSGRGKKSAFDVGHNETLTTCPSTFSTSSTFGYLATWTIHFPCLMWKEPGNCLQATHFFHFVVERAKKLFGGDHS
ncbi:hypothetical protein ACFX13_015588 [Malus domestica]